MYRVLLSAAVVLTVAGCRRSTPDAADVAQPALPSVAPNELRSPDAFLSIRDVRARSKALFIEASRVIMHARCLNCHPNGDVPHQGMNMVLHDPPALRGPQDHGVVGMECTSCHQDRNQELAFVPGAPHWALAPIEMAWVGKTPRDICEQMKDPKRNGGKSLAQIVEHNAHDELVGWGWNPGAGREPVPGTQAEFGAIVAAWVETGAECPEKEAKP
jgi:hypothetical protein